MASDTGRSDRGRAKPAQSQNRTPEVEVEAAEHALTLDDPEGVGVAEEVDSSMTLEEDTTNTSLKSSASPLQAPPPPPPPQALKASRHSVKGGPRSGSPGPRPNRPSSGGGSSEASPIPAKGGGPAASAGKLPRPSVQGRWDAQEPLAANTFTKPLPAHQRVTAPPDKTAEETGEETVTNILADASPSDRPPKPHTPTSAAQELIEDCRREIGRNPDRLRAAHLHYQMGRQYEHPLRQFRDAMLNYQRAYQLMPENLAVVRALRRTLLSGGMFKAALDLVDAEVRLTPDPADKASLLLAKGRLLEDRLQQLTEAREAYRMALGFDAFQPMALKATEQAASQANDWAQVALTLKRTAQIYTDARKRAAVLVQLGHVLEIRLGQPEQAVEHYEAALEVDQGCTSALEALKRLYHARGRLRDQVRMLEMEANRTCDAAVKTTSYYEAAKLWSEHLGHRRHAIDALERALQVSPRDDVLLGSLARLFEAEQDWEGLAQTLARRVEALGDAQCVALMHHLGQIYQERLQDEPQAVLWYERTLKQDPTYTPALHAIAPIYEEGERWLDLIKVHLSEADATNESTRRAATHARVARIYEARLGDLEKATSQHERALSAVDLYPPSFRAQTRLYSTMGRWGELAELYERALEHGDRDDKILHLLRIGTVHEEQLLDPVQALHAYRRALDLDPANIQAIRGMARVSEAAGRHAEVVEALEMEAKLCTDRECTIALLHRAGEILDDHLHDRERAVKTFQRVLTLDGKHRPSLSSLGRIFYRSGRWDELLGIYRVELELATHPEHKARLHIKLGELCEGKLGRPEEAIKHYRTTVTLLPEDQDSTELLAQKLEQKSAWPELFKLWERAGKLFPTPETRALAHYRRGELLEGRMGRAEAATEAFSDALTEVPDYRPALAALSRLRFSRGTWPKLAEQLREDADRLEDPELRVAALTRASAIYAEMMRDTPRGIEGYEQVLAADPSHPAALQALEQLARQKNDSDMLQHVLQHQAATLHDPLGRNIALRELARTLALAGENEALHETLRSLLELQPGDPAALEMLEALALSTQQQDLLQEVDEAYVKHLGNRAVRSAHRTRMAEGIEQAEPRKALSLFREALKEDAENFAAVRGLSRLAQQSGVPDVLTEAARAEADVIGDSAKAALLLVQSAATRLADGSSEAAVPELERALELDPDCAAAAHHLREALARADDYPRLTLQLNRAASACKSPDLASRLWRESARVSANHLEDVSGAISALRRALRRCPDDLQNTSMLAYMLERDGHWNEARELLLRLLEMTQDTGTLVTAHLKLAQLAEYRARDLSTATNHLREVLNRAPHHREALRQLSHILSQRDEQGDEATHLMTRLVETAESSRERVAALLQLARVELRRRRLPRAADALVKAVTQEGPGGAAGAAFRESIGTATTWIQYAQALDAHVREFQAYDGAPSAPYLELACVYADKMGNLPRGLQVLATGLKLNSADLHLHVAQAQMLGVASKPQEAAEVLRQALRLDVQRGQTWRDLAQAFTHMGRPGATSLAQDALIVLDLADEQEQRAVKSYQPQQAVADPGALTLDTAPELLTGLSQPGPAGELLATLSEGLGKLYPPNLEQWGLEHRQRITSRSGDALRAAADHIGQIVGVDEFDFYLHGRRSKDCGIELSYPPSIVVPQLLIEQPPSVQVFTLARLLSLISVGTHSIYTLTPRELEVLLASYARHVIPNFGEGLTSEDVMNDQAKRMHRALPRRVRRLAEEQARQYVAAPISPFTEWVSHRERTANRIAALLADDLPKICGELRTLRELAGDDSGPISVIDSHAVEDILHFWVAEPTLALRRRVKLPRADPA